MRISESESAAGRKSGGSGSKREVMSGLACSIKRRIADTETFDAEVIPDKKLDKKFAGKELDKKLLEHFPKTVAASGDNGEYHTFTFGGPIFKENMNIKTKEPIKIGDNFCTELIEDK